MLYSENVFYRLVAYVERRLKTSHQIDVMDAAGVVLTERLKKSERRAARAPFSMWIVWHMGRICPVLVCRSRQHQMRKQLSHDEILSRLLHIHLFSFQSNIFPFFRLWQQVEREKGNNWISHPHEMAIRRREKNKRDRWKDSQVLWGERSSNSVWSSRIGLAFESEKRNNASIHLV